MTVKWQCVFLAWSNTIKVCTSFTPFTHAKPNVYFASRSEETSAAFKCFRKHNEWGFFHVSDEKHASNYTGRLPSRWHFFFHSARSGFYNSRQKQKLSRKNNPSEEHLRTLSIALQTGWMHAFSSNWTNWSSFSLRKGTAAIDRKTKSESTAKKVHCNLQVRFWEIHAQEINFKHTQGAALFSSSPSSCTI